MISMHRGCARLQFVVALSFAVAASGPLHAAASARPNVLLIVSDEQGFSDFGFAGNDNTQTYRRFFQQPLRRSVMVTRTF